MTDPVSRRPNAARPVAVLMAIFAAFGWASYYVFVLKGAPGTPPVAVLFYPFLVGGLALTAAAVATGGRRAYVELWRSPAAYFRCALMLATQITVLAMTYLLGAVDPALLSLIGDVVATPILAAALFPGPRAALRHPGVIAGLVVSLAGGSLAVAGGHRIGGVHGIAWLAVIACPVVVAAYFLLSARAAEGLPMPAVVGQSMIGAAAATLLISPLVPGGPAGLLRFDPTQAALLVGNGLVSFAVAPALYFGAIRREGLVLPPMLMTGIPIFTLAFSTFLLGEAEPVIALVGIPVSVVGAVLALGGIARVGNRADPLGPPGT